MKRLLISVLVIWSFQVEAREVSSVAKCKHQDGYGTYHGEGANKHQARAVASKSCFNQQLDLFEAHRGRLPNDEEAESIMLSCVNICD
jgi:hypothetical protein